MMPSSQHTEFATLNCNKGWPREEDEIGVERINKKGRIGRIRKGGYRMGKKHARRKRKRVPFLKVCIKQCAQ